MLQWVVLQCTTRNISVFAESFVIALTRAIPIGYYKSCVDICMVGEMKAKMK
jgi:hypothetical protein